MRISNLETPTMRFSRHRHTYGIVIYAEFEDTYGVSRWHPVRNFGDNQSGGCVKIGAAPFLNLL